MHNHVIPPTALELFERDPHYEVRIEDGRWKGGVHVDFELGKSFLEPAEKLRELDENGIRHRRRVCGSASLLLPPGRRARC